MLLWRHGDQIAIWLIETVNFDMTIIPNDAFQQILSKNRKEIENLKKTQFNWYKIVHLCGVVFLCLIFMCTAFYYLTHGHFQKSNRQSSTSIQSLQFKQSHRKIFQKFNSQIKFSKTIKWKELRITQHIRLQGSLLSSQFEPVAGNRFKLRQK